MVTSGELAKMYGSFCDTLPGLTRPCPRHKPTALTPQHPSMHIVLYNLAEVVAWWNEQREEAKRLAVELNLSVMRKGRGRDITLALKPLDPDRVYKRSEIVKLFGRSMADRQLRDHGCPFEVRSPRMMYIQGEVYNQWLAKVIEKLDITKG